MRIRCGFLVLMFFSAAIYTSAAVCAQNGEEETFVVIKAGRVITLAGPEQAGAEVVLVDGKVRLVGTDLDYPSTAKTVDARREVVMPGLILPRTRGELPSYSRSGVYGQRSVTQEIYLDQLDFEPLLEAGFTAACFYPYGTGIPGRSHVYRTAGAKEARDLGPAYLRVTMDSPSRDKTLLRGAIDKARKEIEKVEKARKAWEEKQKKAKEEAAKKEAADKAEKSDEQKKNASEANTGEKKETPPKEGSKDKPATEQKKQPEKFVPPAIDPAVKPLVDWIREKKGPTLLFELARASDLRHLEDVLKKSPEIPRNVFYLTTSSSSDFYHVVEDLGDRKATVLLPAAVGRLPYTATRYNLPAELAAAGCTVVLPPQGYAGADLKYARPRLADLVRSGLPREVALKSVTLNAARLLGLEDRLGTIEKGKNADVIFLDGDPLSPETRVTRVMIGGEIVWEAPKRP